jgi:hypothetical protein
MLSKTVKGMLDMATSTIASIAGRCLLCGLGFVTG